MEETDWASEPLLKDCLFADLLGERKSPDLPPLPDGLDAFAFDQDLSLIPNSALFGSSSCVCDVLCAPVLRSHSGYAAGSRPGESSRREPKASPQGSESGSSQRLPSPQEPAHDPTLLNYGQPNLLHVKQEYPDDYPGVSEAGEWEPPVGATSSYAGLGANYEEREVKGRVLGTYAPAGPMGQGVKVVGSSAAGGARPRLLIATLPSSLTLVRRPAQPKALELAAAEDNRAEMSPSPPSSDGSGLGDPACFGPLRNRSKMHELAIKQRLITEQDPRGAGCVALSAEERRTLVQEGYPVPSKLPLTKQEEESLKIVRRKIKNKLSAQESRRKRKEYMETLEQRVQGFHSENASLRQRLRQLEASNRSLGGQLKKFQAMLQGEPSAAAPAAPVAASQPGSSTSAASSGADGRPAVSIATQTSVCLTALVLLFAVCLPTLPAELMPLRSLAPLGRAGKVGLGLPPQPPFRSPASVTSPSRTLLGDADGPSCHAGPSLLLREALGGDSERAAQAELLRDQDRRTNFSAHLHQTPTITTAPSSHSSN